MVASRERTARRMQEIARVYAGNSIPSVRCRLEGAAKLALTARLITFLNAAWNCSISGRVPTVIREYVGHRGQMRPINTFCAAIASITSFAGRLVSSMKQLDCEGM